jgi:uncharacterized membrane protein
MLHTVAVYLHPIAGLATVLLAFWAASLGLRARSPRPGAEDARRWHAVVGPTLFVLVILNWVGGLASVWWARPELEATASGHFMVGSMMAAVFGAAALVSRRVSDDPRARVLHPILGAAGLALSGFQVFLGLQLVP